MYRGLDSFSLVLGLTCTLIAVRPTDEQTIPRLITFAMGVSYLCMFWFMYLSVVILGPFFFDEGNRACIDYQGVTVPCWVSMCHALGYVALVILLFEVSIRRGLHAKRRAGGRFSKIWRLWGKWLIGYTVSRTMLILVPYLFFEDGRTFLGSVSGASEIVTMVATSALSLFAFTNRWQFAVQTWVAHYGGEIIESMALATLMSHGGKPLDEVMATAKAKLRCVTLNSMDVSDLNFDPGDRPHDRFSKSVPTKPRDIDIYISHNWHDPPLEKWTALTAYCDEWAKTHDGREPRLWIDALCLDPDSVSEPQNHPVYLMASNRFVILKGPSFMDNLWNCVEVLMWTEAGGATTAIDVLPIAGCTLSVENFVLASPASHRHRHASLAPESAFQFAMLEVIRACGSTAKFDRRVHAIVREASIQSEIRREDGGTLIRRRSRKLSEAIASSDEVGHLVRQFDRYRPGCWWANIFLLVVRLMSTSMVAPLQDQATQAALTAIITLASATVLNTVQPYRQHTDNSVCVSGQLIIFCWVQFLLYRVIGVVGGLWMVLCGIGLVLSSIALFAYAGYLFHKDYQRREFSATDVTNNDSGNSPQEDDELEMQVDVQTVQDVELEIFKREANQNLKKPVTL